MANAIPSLFFVLFSSYVLSELCPGLVLVSSPVAKCDYKQHRYRNKCIATGSIYAWALSVGGVGPPLKTFNIVDSQYFQEGVYKVLCH